MATDVIRDIQMLRSLSLAPGADIKYCFQGRLTWRTDSGFLRLQIGNARKAFRLQGDLLDLQTMNLGDVVEVSGEGTLESALLASSIRLVERSDGTELRYVDAFQNDTRMLWRHVQYSGVVREVFEANGCYRLLIGEDVIVKSASFMSEERLTSLLGKHIRVRGASFLSPARMDKNASDLMYIGVIAPDRQITLVEPQPAASDMSTDVLTIIRGTIDFVGPRYIAVSGHGISTAMSGHLRVGDVVDVRARNLDSHSRCTESIWLTQKSVNEPALPVVVTGKQIFDSEYLHRKVVVRGIVRHCYSTERGLELMLSDGQRTFLVRLSSPEGRRQVDQYVRGAVVIVTGVIRSIPDGADEDIAINLDVANAEDLVIAETPMQFRIWLVKLVAAGIFATALLLMFWYWTLKRQVQSKTAELSTSTSRMVAASSAVRDGLLIFDAASHVRFVSDKVLLTLGVSIPVGDTAGNASRCIQDLVCDADAFTESWDDVFRDPLRIFEGEFDLRDSNRCVFAFSAPVYDSTGRPDGRIWTFEDITQRRKLEDETLQTRKLGAIGRLAGGVAHDFNNLLQVIGSNLELMRYSTDKDWIDSEETPLDTASAALQRGADLTRQLLTFARTSRIEATPTDVNQVLQRTARMLDRTLGDHIRLSVSLTTEPAVAEIDSGQLEQAVINLCLNSSEAIGLNGGYVRITTKTTQHNQIGAAILICVEDDGCGMTPEVLSRVFEPFFTTKDIDKGTGLGLATAFGAVKQMQGRIECSSTLDVGSCFRIYLPIIVDAAYVPEPLVTPATENFVARRILLVDDDARVLSSVNQLLVNLGHDVICAGGGIEAIATLQRESFDVVILDLSMPEMTGWQVLQTIRREHGDLKVIVCSGYSDDSAEIVASDVEPDAFLNKPFQLGQLSIALESVSR